MDKSQLYFCAHVHGLEVYICSCGHKGISRSLNKSLETHIPSVTGRLNISALVKVQRGFLCTCVCICLSAPYVTNDM